MNKGFHCEGKVMIYELALDQLNFVIDIVTRGGNRMSVLVSTNHLFSMDQD